MSGNPEDMLAAALRAHASGAPRGTTPPPAPPPVPVRVRRGVSASWILLGAIFLGLLGGAIAGWLSTI